MRRETFCYRCCLNYLREIAGGKQGFTSQKNDHVPFTERHTRIKRLLNFLCYISYRFCWIKSWVIAHSIHVKKYKIIATCLKCLKLECICEWLSLCRLRWPFLLLTICKLSVNGTLLNFNKRPSPTIATHRGHGVPSVVVFFEKYRGLGEQMLRDRSYTKLL